MKSLKLISLMMVIGLMLAGCGKSDNSKVESSNSDSKIVQDKSQSDAKKTDSSNSEITTTKANSYDKATIEKKAKEMKGMTEEGIKDMKWSPDNKELVFATDDGQQNRVVYLWKIGEEQPKKANLDSGWGTEFGWSPNSEFVLVDAGTSQIRSITIINKSGDCINGKNGKDVLSFNTSGIAHQNMKLEQFWSSDSSKIAIAKYNDKITALPDVEVSGVFDIVVYDVKNKAEKTLLKSTATDYYTVEKWLDNDTLSCNKYAPKNSQLGSIVEKKDIKVS